MSPLGIGIGLGLSAYKNSLDSFYIAVGILQALAAGTIFYVVVFEIILREKSKKDVPGLTQFACVFVGFSAMLVVELCGESFNGAHRIFSQ